MPHILKITDWLINKKTIVFYNTLTNGQKYTLYTWLIHSLISQYHSQDNFREGVQPWYPWGGLPGSGKVFQGFKLCSILQVSEGYIRLCSLTTVDREGTGGSALQILEKLPGWGSFQSFHYPTCHWRISQTVQSCWIPSQFWYPISNIHPLDPITAIDCHTQFLGIQSSQSLHLTINTLIMPALLGTLQSSFHIWLTFL